jgi:hypothetical protein
VRRFVWLTCLVLLAAVGATSASWSAVALDRPGCPSPSKKTLTDHYASQVSLTPVRSTVATLRAMPVPAGAGAGQPRTQPEKTTYALTVQLVGARLMSDHDIHLLVADSQGGATMITELPDATCPVAAKSPVAAQMETARRALLAAIGRVRATHWKALNRRAKITGVGFFDTVHGQIGVAPNGFELHPLLSFSLLPSLALVSWKTSSSGHWLAHQAAIKLCAEARRRYRAVVVERAYPLRRVVRIQRTLHQRRACSTFVLRWRFPDVPGEHRLRLSVAVRTPGGVVRTQAECRPHKRCHFARRTLPSAAGGGD